MTDYTENNTKNLSLSMAAAISLSLRLVVGFIYWGGGSRRFIYAPMKLDPNSKAYMGSKLLHAAPGAAFGIGNIIKWLSLHLALMHFALIFFSLLELIFGLFLILGLMTRFSAFVSMGLSVFLMVSFGWLGSTCIDEWTMAACTFAMSMPLLLTGSSVFSLDNLIINKTKLGHNKLFTWLFSGDIKINYSKWGVIFGVISFLFTIGFYDYYRGAVYSGLKARTSPKTHHITVNNSDLNIEKNSFTFTSEIDAGPDTQAMYIIKMSIVNNKDKTPVYTWNAPQLMNSHITHISNVFRYSQYGYSSYGIKAPLAATATIHLTGKFKNINTNNSYDLKITNIEGKTFIYPITNIQ